MSVALFKLSTASAAAADAARELPGPGASNAQSSIGYTGCKPVGIKAEEPDANGKLSPPAKVSDWNNYSHRSHTPFFIYVMQDSGKGANDESSPTTSPSDWKDTGKRNIKPLSSNSGHRDARESLMQSRGGAERGKAVVCQDSKDRPCKVARTAPSNEVRKDVDMGADQTPRLRMVQEEGGVGRVRGICEHNRRKSQCKDCRGSQICPHSRHVRTAPSH